MAEGQTCVCTQQPPPIDPSPPEEIIKEPSSAPITEPVSVAEVSTTPPQPKKPQSSDAKKPIISKTVKKTITASATIQDVSSPSPAPPQINTPDSEAIIKKYHIAHLRNLLRVNRAAGYLELTNKRIIFKAENNFFNKKTIIRREHKIEGLAGIEAVSNYRFSFTRIVFGLITMLAMATLVAAGAIAATHGLPWAESTAINMMSPPLTGLFSYAFEGLQESWYPDINPISLVIGLATGFGGVAMFLLLRNRLWLKLIFIGMTLGGFGASALTYNMFAFVLFIMSIAFAILGLVIFSWIPDLVISAITKEGKIVRLVCARRYTDILHGTQGVGYAEVAPTEETEVAIKELGTILLS